MSTPVGFVSILPMKNTIVFPGLSQIIRVGRERSVNALLHAEKNGFWIVATQQKTKDSGATSETVESHDIFNVGTLCRIDSIKGNKKSGYQVILRAFHRVTLEDVRLAKSSEVGEYLECQPIESADINEMDEPTEKAMLESLLRLSKEILRLLPGNTEQLSDLLDGVQDLGYLTALVAGNIELELLEKQKILEMRNLQERSLHLLNTLQSLKQNLEIQAEIRGKLNQKIGQTQRQHILREQLRTIREELGETDEASVEDKLQKKISEARLPEEVEKVAQRELKRLTDVGNQSPEAHIIRNYLDLITDLPWSKKAEDKDVDLEEATRVLNEDHFGLDKVKKRIIQHLAILKLKKDVKGSILLLVGPPGVGKTSLGQSIARVLGRKFVRVAVGGVRDDAEIRGHRRTYIGAMPGRIIQGLKKAGENNPVFLLDEIDKLSRSFSGDPAAALLEVLDPEQNSTFLDHYLDVSFDLSKVFFVATANSLEGIPGPLLDRMEVIDLSGYTTSEKMHIAKNHLLPKQLVEHGMIKEQVQITDEALVRLISAYTREAGVRELNRKIASLLRAASEKVVSQPEKTIVINSLDLEDLLGSEKYQSEFVDNFTQAGIATGMAWTPVGGDILFIESSVMPGKGELTITGQLGDVMKESAQIALSLVRSTLAEHGTILDKNMNDIHIHVPAGAIPKDGPSAGVTMFTALASVLTKRPVKSKLAMTGEITLRGKVLPVGGIKEKVIAAHRAGITEVILPAKNKKDLKDIPEEVRNCLQFHFVESIDEVAKIALNLSCKADTSRDEQNWIGSKAPPSNLG